MLGSHHQSNTSLEEPPVDEDQDEQPQPRKGSVLLHQQLPVNAHSGTTILLTIIAQAAANLAHALQIVTAVQQILNVLRHDLCDIAQLVVELVEVLRGAGIGIGSTGFCDEVVKLHEGVGPQRWVVVVGGLVGGGELGGEVGEVGESELARVGTLADAEKNDVGVEEVVDGVGAGLDAGLGFGVAGEFAQDLADLVLDFGEGGFGLMERRLVDVCSFYGIGRTDLLFFID